MTASLSTRLDRAVETLPRAYPGPGGAVAVLRDGEVLVRHAWGWANAETPHPVHAAHAVPHVLHHQAVHLRAWCWTRSPTRRCWMATCAPACRCCEQPAPGALHLCHNQSGLRDYWAVAMLHGSPVEAPFGDTEAARVIAGTRTLHFAPGTRHSYVNQNFRILSDIVQERTGRGFAELLRTRIFERAGMATALSWPPTRAPCRTAPRATRARRRAAFAPRRTASCGPAMPASAPASTT